MKRKGGDGGRTMVFDVKNTERKMKETMEIEDLCSKMTSLIPHDYHLDTTSQGSSDLPEQLMQAANYIKDLRERVEKLKQKRDDCYSKIQGATNCGDSSLTNTGSCPHDVRVQFSGATDFEASLTISSGKRIRLYELMDTIEQDHHVEILEASSCIVDDGKIVHTMKCRARSSELVLDASAVATSLRRLLAASNCRT